MKNENNLYTVMKHSHNMKQWQLFLKHDSGLSCLRNRLEMIWGLWRGALYCWKQMVNCYHKGVGTGKNNK